MMRVQEESPKKNPQLTFEDIRPGEWFRKSAHGEPRNLYMRTEPLHVEEDEDEDELYNTVDTTGSHTLLMLSTKVCRVQFTKVDETGTLFWKDV